MSEEEKTYGSQIFNKNNKTVLYPCKFPSHPKKDKSKKKDNTQKKGDNK